LLRERARRADGSAEAILLRDGMVTEGAASNVFVVSEGVARTPPKSRFILPGVTRDLVIELLRGAGSPCAEAAIPESELRVAREIWMTSSTLGIAPITQLDGAPVGDGRPGPAWRAADALYQQFKRRLGAARAAPARAIG
jgi:D-alanine transaminase